MFKIFKAGEAGEVSFQCLAVVETQKNYVLYTLVAVSSGTTQLMNAIAGVLQCEKEKGYYHINTFPVLTVV